MANSYQVTVQLHQPTLKLHIVTNGARGERTLDLEYEIGGKELVYKGLDGDEYHSKVQWDGDSLLFTTVEHERGREIPSRENWTVIESGNTLQRVKSNDAAKDSTPATFILERVS